LSINQLTFLAPVALIVPQSPRTRIEAADYYVRLHVAEKQHWLRETIKSLETKLDPKQFVRIHWPAIVNIAFVREIRRQGRTDGWVLLADGGRRRA
jgi:two-component system LytT family response regulator